MNSLSLQNLNGTRKALRGLAGGVSFGLEHEPMQGIGEEDGYNLTPNWRYDRTEIQPAPDEYMAFRRELQPGETYSSDRTWPSKPMTPQNDERNLPDSLTQRPMIQLPHVDYPGSYPHSWISYEEMVAATSPDFTPRPPGWTPPGFSIDEEAKAVASAMPAPWSSEDRMAYDISGFGSLHGAMHGLGLSIPFGMSDAAVSGVTKIAVEEAAKGASPSLIESIINFGAVAGGLFMQYETIKTTKNIEEQKLDLMKQQLAAQARAANVPVQMVMPSEPFYKNPVVIGIGAVAIVGAAAYAMSRMGRGGRRR